MAVRYSDLINSDARETDIQAFLAEGETVAVTFRIPKNLKDAAMETSTLRGLSFSAFVRNAMIQELSKRL